jgi:hypothetical protein
MNRKQLKEVISSHLSKAGENKQKINQDYYQQNKEQLKAKQKERRAKKKSESKFTVTSINQNDAQKNSVHVTVKKIQTNKG